MTTGNAPDGDEGGFLSRWSRRKGQVRQGVAVAEPAPGLPAAPLQAGLPIAQVAAPAEPAPAPAVPPAALPPPPTLADVASLTAESDYTRFVARGVDTGVKNAALKKLFTDPHFNIMDGLDTYIDDYGLPDPLPEGMLRQMAQSHALGLFADDPLPPPLPPPPPPTVALPLQAAPAAFPAPPAPPVAPAGVVDTPAVPPTDAGTESPETLPPPKPNPDEDAALRLQPHDAAGPTGPGPGAGPHAGRPH